MLCVSSPQSAGSLHTARWANHSLEIYEPFDAVTKNSFVHALGEQQIHASEETIDKLMDAYNHLPA